MCELCQIMAERFPNGVDVSMEAMVGVRNVKAFDAAMTADVVRCSRCECAVGQPSGPDERYVIHIFDGRTYCEACVEMMLEAHGA